MKKINCKPIGVFDSGLGGLTVVKEIMRCLPEEEIIYFGDTARVPYGTKSRETIIKFSRENTDLLMQYDVKMVIVACNSSSSYAIPSLRQAFNVPIVSVIEPGARKAAGMTRNKRVGVIATTATINSGKYVSAIKKLDGSIKVYGQACPLFVPLVEEGWADRSVTMAVAEHYLSPLKKLKVDTLIMGCTHYPLLKEVLRLVMGLEVELIDSAREVAIAAKNMLEVVGYRENKSKGPRHHFLASDRPQMFERMAKRFLGGDVQGIFHKRKMNPEIISKNFHSKGK
jgi:glutamate racemase